MFSRKKLLFPIERWTPSWLLPEFGVLVAFLCCSALAFGFLQIADEVGEGGSRGFDERIMLALRDPLDKARPIGPAWLESAMIDITALGGVTNLTLITIAIVAYLLVTRRYANAAFVTFAVIGGAILVRLLKFSFARPRPELVDHLVQVASSSFPSGHATASAVTYLTLGALVARTERKKAARAFVFCAAGALTLMIGISRVFLGVHYPTDVLAGWTLGAAWALFCWTVARLLRPRDNVTDQTPEAGEAPADVRRIA